MKTKTEMLLISSVSHQNVLCFIFRVILKNFSTVYSSGLKLLAPGPLPAPLPLARNLMSKI